MAPAGGRTDHRAMSESSNVLTPPPPPPTPTDPGTRPRLVRRKDHRIIAGVCAGLGDYFDVDPVIFRAVFVVLAVLGGAGFLLYGLAWLLLPSATGPGAPPHDAIAHRTLFRTRRAGAWLGVAILIAGTAVLLSNVGDHGALHWIIRPGIVWGAALILLGVLVYQRGSERRSDAEGLPRASAAAPVASPAPAAGPAPFEAPTGSPAGPIAFDAASLPPAPAPPATDAGTTAASGYAWPAPAPAPIVETAPAAPAAPASGRRRRERSALGWVTLGALLLAVGVAAVLDQAGVISMSVGRFVALALAVLGVGLLVGTRWGRARWLIVPGIVLIPFVLAGSLIRVPLTGGVGDRFLRPQTVSEVLPAYRLAAGHLDIDLRDVDFGSLASPLSVTATVGAGELVVRVPAGALVTIHGSVGAGQILVRSEPFDASDRAADGFNASIDQSYGPPGTTPALVLNLGAGFGQITVIRASLG